MQRETPHGPHPISTNGPSRRSRSPYRRQALAGGAAFLAATTMGLIRPKLALGARSKIVVRVERDLQNLDPGNRAGPVDVNVLFACMQGLVGFKPGSTEWRLD